MTPPALSERRLPRPLAWLLLLVFLCLAPFLNKAVHLDDTLFLRAAEQIQKRPGDFYGFAINWYGEPMPMTEVFENPPLTCYYLAFAETLLGRSEIALHLAMLLPALVAIWGAYVLARQLGGDAFTAGLLAAATPVFMLSATTLMCDVMLLAFWVWSVAWLDRGLKQPRALAFLASGVLGAAAVITKFTGLALVPLLAAYALLRTRRAGGWLAAVLIPLACAGGYEWLTHGLYGRGLLFEAARYATAARETVGHPFTGKLAVGLAFMGGCFLPLTLVLLWNWPRRSLALTGLPVLLLSFLLPLGPPFKDWLWLGEEFHPLFYAQAVAFIAGGLILLIAVGLETWCRRDAVTLMLCLWIAGIFVFATLVNWTTNGRSLLPLLPALAIVAARRIAEPAAAWWRRCWPVVPAGALSLWLAQADFHLANSARLAAQGIVHQNQLPGRRLVFQGHWGFQYYMENLGAQAMSVNDTNLQAGQLLVLPALDINTLVQDIPTNRVRLVDARYYWPCRHLTVMNAAAGAGFYASSMGPLPFAFVRRIRPERYYVFEVTHSPGPPSTLPEGPGPAGALMQQWLRERGQYK